MRIEIKRQFSFLENSWRHLRRCLLSPLLSVLNYVFINIVTKWEANTKQFAIHKSALPWTRWLFFFYRIFRLLPEKLLPDFMWPVSPPFQSQLTFAKPMLFTLWVLMLSTLFKYFPDYCPQKLRRKDKK